MAAIETIIIMALLATGIQSGNRLSNIPRHEEKRDYYAAVFLNRSHVSVGASANIGLFRRQSDTAWVNSYRPNLFTFGIGMWARGSTKRYYIAAGNGVHRSDDGRVSWRVLTDWHTEEILSLALDPVDSSRIYVGTPWGVFRSTDDGKSWQKKSQGMKRGFVQKVLIDHFQRRTLYACSEDDLYCSADEGGHWKPLHVGVRGLMTVVQHPVDPAHLLVGTEDSGVRVSFDRGKTWKIGAGLPGTAFYALCVSSSNETIYAGGYLSGVWKSKNGGLSWDLLWQSDQLEAVYTIFVHPEDSRHIMIGTSGQGIFESFDEGKSWRQAGLRGCHVKQIELYP
jgi:photosystem II stability/assembly factor-like uncharacterized protein